MKIVTSFGKSLGIIISTAVMYIAVPSPSLTRRKIPTKMKPQVEGIRVINLGRSK
jgi:hypothetical protein